MFPRPQTVGTSPRGTVADSPATGRTGFLSRLPGVGGAFDADPNHDRAGAATRTDTSSAAGRRKKTGDPVATATIVAAGVGLVLTVAGWMVSRAGRKLRKPTPEQIHDFAGPTGALLARHFDLSWLGEDIADVAAAGVVVGDWAGDGPLTTPARPDVHQVGLPDPPDRTDDVSRETSGNTPPAPSAARLALAPQGDYDAVGIPPRDTSTNVRYLT
jgi:hypothetical protein